ncbi:hypothetical protein D3C87_2075540 [compost metagenome]
MEYDASILSAVTASLSLREMVRERPISSGNRLRASCCVMVEPPCGAPRSVCTTDEAVRRQSMPQWS